MTNRPNTTDQNNWLECRVLVTEDFPDSQRLISFHFNQTGSVVFLANDRQIALDLALEARGHDSPFDVILMDIQQPVVDTNRATIKPRGTGHNETIVAITAHTESHDQETGIKGKDVCDAPVMQPVDSCQLNDLIKHYAFRHKYKVPIEATSNI